MFCYKMVNNTDLSKNKQDEVTKCQDYKKQKTDIRALKTTLALIESYFHGVSSGIDPLVSLLKMPVLRPESVWENFLFGMIMAKRLNQR